MRVRSLFDEHLTCKPTRIALETAVHDWVDAPNGARALKAVANEIFESHLTEELGQIRFDVGRIQYVFYQRAR